MSWKQFLFSISLVFALSSQLMSCSEGEIHDQNPEILYQEAEEDISDDRYLLALDKLRILKNKFPYSKYSALAQLRIADVYFLQESYLEAATAYELFRDLHPKHEKTSYAYFRAAESYFLDIPGNIARDLSSARKALESFLDFMRKFGKDEKFNDAQKRVDEIKNILADKELYIANFYLRQDAYKAARGRFQTILDKYPGTAAYGKVKLKWDEVEAKAKEQEAKEAEELKQRDLKEKNS